MGLFRNLKSSLETPSNFVTSSGGILLHKGEKRKEREDRFRWETFESRTPPAHDFLLLFKNI
jgi:hypothetical protein